MKKTLIALAVLTVSGAAFAQSTVTLSGVIQAGFQRHISAATANYVLPGSTSTDPTAAKLTKGTVQGLALMDRAFTLTAVEDLGGGLSAFGNTKMEQASDFRGAQVAFADTNLGLTSKSLGEIKFSNTRTSDTAVAIASSAISLRDGLYDDNGIFSRAAVDVLTYTTPELVPGLKASFAFVEANDGDIDTPATNKSSQVLGLSYVNGPLTVMGAYKTKLKNAVASSTQISKANLELAAMYNLGFATVGLGYDGASTEGTTALATTGAVLQSDKAAMGFTITAPVGAINLGLEYFKRGESTETNIGGMYALSKRTDFTVAYGMKDYPKLNNAANVVVDSQYRISLRHKF